MQAIQFMKNVAILGGLAALIVMTCSPEMSPL
jgi:hypothetical protein